VSARNYNQIFCFWGACKGLQNFQEKLVLKISKTGFLGACKELRKKGFIFIYRDFKK